MGDTEVRRRRAGKKGADSSPKTISTTEDTSGRSGLKFVVIGILGTLVFGYFNSPLDTVEIELPTPVKFEGHLKVNDVLARGERIIPGSVGPESIEMDQDGNIYTGLVDGRIIKIHPSATGAVGEGLVEDVQTRPIPGVKPIEGHKTPRPLGLRLHGGYLYVVDAYYGLYSLNMKTRKVRSLVKPDDVNPSMKFPNDLDITKDGKYIYFTDTSSKWDLGLLFNDMTEGTCEGRLFRLTVETGELKTLAGKLCFANGVQLSSDENTLVVAETSRFRVLFVEAKSGKVKSVTVTPGMPDNIRRSKNGNYWVALPIARLWLFDFVARFPVLRKIVTGLVPLSFVTHLLPTRSGLAVEVNERGQIVGCIHDNAGKTAQTISEIYETKDGLLLAGSYNQPYMTKAKR